MAGTQLLACQVFGHQQVPSETYWMKWNAATMKAPCHHLIQFLVLVCYHGRWLQLPDDFPTIHSRESLKNCSVVCYGKTAIPMVFKMNEDTSGPRLMSWPTMMHLTSNLWESQHLGQAPKQLLNTSSSELWKIDRPLSRIDYTFTATPQIGFNVKIKMYFAMGQINFGVHRQMVGSGTCVTNKWMNESTN